MIKIEICVDQLASVEACAAAGADRIELCAGLVEGGTTPSAGFLKAARRIFSGRIMMMIRPRGGDFLYSEAEAGAMEADIRLAAEYGADGVVFGCLTKDGRIDEALTNRLQRAASGLDCTFHRAFDVTRDLSTSLETLIQLGIPRVLTSGGKPGVMEALPELAALVKQADGRISILPGGGIKAADVALVVESTSVTECHLSARTASESPMLYRRPDIPMGALTVPGEYEQRIADVALIRMARGA
jgi:copper homeostasis protein